MSSQSKRTILILLVCQFLICLGMSLIFPVMPFIKKEYNFSAFDRLGTVGFRPGRVCFCLGWSPFLVQSFTGV